MKKYIMIILVLLATMVHGVNRRNLGDATYGSGEIKVTVSETGTVTWLFSDGNYEIPLDVLIIPKIMKIYEVAMELVDYGKANPDFDYSATIRTTDLIPAKITMTVTFRIENNISSIHSEVTDATTGHSTTIFIMTPDQIVAFMDMNNTANGQMVEMMNIRKGYQKIIEHSKEIL